jgi:hypothetical protein
MRSRSRNVTITIEEPLARWARLEAARQDISVSRLLGEFLKERMIEKEGYQRAMRRALARQPFLSTDGRYLSREEAHDRAHLR